MTDHGDPHDEISDEWIFHLVALDIYNALIRDMADRLNLRNYSSNGRFASGGVVGKREPFIVGEVSREYLIQKQQEGKMK